MRTFVFTLTVLVLSATAAWARPTHPRTNRLHSHHLVRHTTRAHYRGRRNRRPRWWKEAVASPIHGTRESLVHQNQMVGEDQLERIQDDEQLSQLTESEALSALPVGTHITVESALPNNRRYCRPWTKEFLTTFSDAYWAEFHAPVQVNSAVRTVEVQQHLRRHNRNAAGLEGDTASPHLTGATVDISKRGMNRTELKWSREYLYRLQAKGKLDAEEEFRQPVFHITVYRSFDPESAEAAAELAAFRYGIANPPVIPSISTN